MGHAGINRAQGSCARTKPCLLKVCSLLLSSDSLDYEIRFQITRFSLLSASMWLISSCTQPHFINLTSKNISQNPSGIYTLQTELDVQDRGISNETLEVFAVVGGERLP